MSDELKAADALLDQADALLHRHRGAASLITASGDDLVADDLPLLTEVVDGRHAPAVPVEPPSDDQPKVDLAERLVALDGFIAREVEAWLAEELPQILGAELERLAAQVRMQALAQMRATLLPALSRRISDTLNGDGPA
jgi:hypothetical protein